MPRKCAIFAFTSGRANPCVRRLALLTAAPWWPAWWLTLAAVLLYWDQKTGSIPSWVGFTLYGGFVILCAVDTVWRTISKTRSGARRAIDRAT